VFGLYVGGLGLYPLIFFLIVLPRRLFGGTRKRIVRKQLSHNLDEHSLEYTLVLWFYGAFPTRAHGGEGALAPSCRAPQGHDQPREILRFYNIW